MRKNTEGFTLIEILIAIAIIVLLVIFVFINLRGQSARAYDVKRKADLYKLNTALEDYNNDHGSYPPASVVQDCGSAALDPYLAKVPCDPQLGTPYGYFPAANGGLRVCAHLGDPSDPGIAAENCAGAAGCGVGPGFNYCQAQGVAPSAVGTADQTYFGGPATTTAPTATPAPGGGGGGAAPTATPIPTPTLTPTPTPTPTPAVGAFACAPPDSDGVSRCNHYNDPVASGCPARYTDVNCNNACATATTFCRE